MHHPNTLKIITKTFTYLKLPVTVNVKIPRVELELASKDATETVASYSEFRSTVEQFRPKGQEEKQKGCEIKAIKAIFPTILQGHLQCAMAAWLYVLCHVDDLVDLLGPGVGVLTVQKLALIMGSLSDDPEERQEKLIKGSNDGNGVETKAVTWMEYSVSCFRRYAKAWIPDKIFESFCSEVGEVFTSMSDDIRFKSNKDNDLWRYLSIRTTAFGTGPFFSLLRCGIGFEGQPTTRVRLLQMHISTLSALQNDIVGLERDLATGEWMNYAVVYSGCQDPFNGLYMGDFEAGIQKLLEEYHAFLDIALGIWTRIFEDSSAKDQQLAGSLLNFLSHHYDWACQTTRYKYEHTKVQAGSK